MRSCHHKQHKMYNVSIRPTLTSQRNPPPNHTVTPPHHHTLPYHSTRQKVHYSTTPPSFCFPITHPTTPHPMISLPILSSFFFLNFIFIPRSSFILSVHHKRTPTPNTTHKQIFISHCTLLFVSSTTIKLHDYHSYLFILQSSTTLQ